MLSPCVFVGPSSPLLSVGDPLDRRRLKHFRMFFGICCRTQATDSCTMADAGRKWTLCKCFYEVCELFFVSFRARYFNQIGNRRRTVVRRWPKLQKLTKWLCFSRASLTFLWFKFKVFKQIHRIFNFIHLFEWTMDIIYQENNIYGPIVGDIYEFKEGWKLRHMKYMH